MAGGVNRSRTPSGGRPTARLIASRQAARLAMPMTGPGTVRSRPLAQTSPTRWNTNKIVSPRSMGTTGVIRKGRRGIGIGTRGGLAGISRSVTSMSRWRPVGSLRRDPYRYRRRDQGDGVCPGAARVCKQVSGPRQTGLQPVADQTTATPAPLAGLRGPTERSSHGGDPEGGG